MGRSGSTSSKKPLIGRRISNVFPTAERFCENESLAARCTLKADMHRLGEPPGAAVGSARSYNAGRAAHGVPLVARIGQPMRLIRP